ncbi:MAG: ABC-type phosphate transport system, periplasmic component [Bacteroidetes bacterium]|nr:ABC-type phosphate transport system, periplasmic component [Bacteroidota bacterium]
MKWKTNRLAFAGLAVLLVALLLATCKRDPNKVLDETATRGNIKIGVDESFTLLAEAELYVFHSIYQHAQITPLYKPELDVRDDFMNDSVRMMITTRKLTDEEVEFLKAKLINPRTTTIAYDGLAFVVNSRNRDSMLIYNDLKDIFKGRIRNWNQINPSNKAGKIAVVFDNNKSSSVRYIREKFEIQDSLPSYCLAANNNEEVINFVERNVNALGVVAVNWISDKDDSLTNGFLNQVRVVGLSQEFDTEGTYFYKPYQAYIADKSYPLVREVYAINRETFTGLGSGFIKYMSIEGQRIVLKMGMVPATMPVRLVRTHSE